MNDILQDEAEYFGGIIQELQEQNKRYREALEFIGNHANESILMDNYMYTNLIKEVVVKALEE